MPTLYVVATPIGNLDDITLRALRTLRSVSLIAAEDTRKTRRLLDRNDIKTPMTSYHEHNKYAKLGYLLSQLEQGDVALVSEAGTPGISDPGFELVVSAARRGIPVVPIPGPSVIAAATSVAALPTDRFTFLGFLPRVAGSRKQALESVLKEPGTLVVLEAPHRLVETLRDILDILGDRRIAVCRELTKLHEEIFRGTVGQAIEHFPEPRGEFTLVIEGSRRSPAKMTVDITGRLETLQQAGATAKEAVARLAAETGLPRKELYQAWLKLGKKERS